VSWDTQEIIDVDDSRLILVNRVYMRGLGSGVEVDATGVQLWTIKDGKAERLKLHQSRSDALEAAGLREEPAGPREQAMLQNGRLGIGHTIVPRELAGKCPQTP
jgi:hypothetical protein